MTKLKFIQLDREFNLTPCSRTRFFNFRLVSALIELQISLFIHTSVLLKVLNLRLLFKLVKIILIKLVKSSRLLFNSYNFKRWIRINT